MVGTNCTSPYLSWHLLYCCWSHPNLPRPQLTKVRYAFLMVTSSASCHAMNRPLDHGIWCITHPGVRVPRGFQAPRSDRARASEPFLDVGARNCQWTGDAQLKYTYINIYIYIYMYIIKYHKCTVQIHPNPYLLFWVLYGALHLCLYYQLLRQVFDQHSQNGDL